jgi:hypothetical protein
VTAGAAPFAGAGGGVFVGFHGTKNGTGPANDDNAFLYYDFTSGKYFPIVDAGTLGVGHLDNVLVSGSKLFIADMSTAGIVNGPGGTGSGAIYEFDLATPEPATIFLAAVALGFLLVRSRNCSASNTPAIS